MNIWAEKALEEYNSTEKTVRRGGVGGKPFWNVNSTQFIYVPQFMFPTLPGIKTYRYTATDSSGKTYSFDSNSPTATLDPIWKDLAVGFVELKVEGIHHHLDKVFTVGARTFYKATPFLGKDAYPERACSYKECAIKAFRFLFNDPATKYWLDKGVPDPNYYHNAYPSKMISSIVNAMIYYAEIEPDMKEKALKLATNAADYLISITYPKESHLAGLPPTYSFKGLNREVVNETAPMAEKREHTIMMIYPASVGSMYLKLEKATGDKKYFEYATLIANYYEKTVLPNGSWYLLVNEKTGQCEGVNCCVTIDILDFLRSYYERTKEEKWHVLEKNYSEYVNKMSLENYNWEGQFEDIVLTGNYQNLTHFAADNLISYYAKNYSSDEKMIETAEELMRYVEDQFVIWGEHAPWNIHLKPGDYWYYPAGVEQYNWYVPIDSSTSVIMGTMLDLYEVNKNPLLLEKARVLGDSITRMQNSETGQIPTHWMWEDCTTNIKNFWINCHIATAFRMMQLAKIVGEI